jgi:hypothetical protein
MWTILMLSKSPEVRVREQERKGLKPAQQR